MEGREVIEPDPPHVIQIVHTRLFECATCRSADLREGPRGVHDLDFTAAPASGERTSAFISELDFYKMLLNWSFWVLFNQCD